MAKRRGGEHGEATHSGGEFDGVTHGGGEHGGVAPSSPVAPSPSKSVGACMVMC